MKLAEIINVGHLSAEPDSNAAKMISDRLANEGVFVKKLTSSTDLVQLGSFYGARRDGDVLAWVELGDQIEIGENIYNTIKFIYVPPKSRKKPIVGAFLLGMKGELDRPVILGSDEYGGALFKGGQELVKAMHASTRFDVSVLDLATGERSPFTDDALASSRGKTLVFEQGNVPMFHDAGDAGIFYLFETD